MKFVWTCLLALTLVACGGGIDLGPVGTGTDFSSGISYNYNGLGMEKAYVTLNDEVHSSKEVALGTKPRINVVGIYGWELKEGNAMVGLDLVVVEDNGTVVLEIKDMLAADYPDGVPGDQADAFNAYIEVLEPMEPNREYDVKLTVYDKNGEGKINVNYSMQTIAGSLPNSTDGITTNTQNTTFERVYLAVDGDYLPDTKVPHGEHLELQVREVTGFTDSAGNYLVDYSMLFYDVSGNFLDSLFFQVSGDEVGKLTGGFDLTGPIQAGQSYVWKNVFRDHYSDAKLETQCTLEVQ